MKKFHPLISISLSVLALVSLSALKPTGVAAGCGGPVPSTPTKVSAVSGPANGQVTLYWDTSAYADHYGVVYGVESNKYVYGSLNIGGEKARSFTVGYLTPGTKYYFKVVGMRDCATSPFSAEVSAVAIGGGMATEVVVQATGPAPVSIGGPVAPVETAVVSGSVGKHKLSASPGPNVGEVTLSWQHADTVDNYHLVYGTKPGKFEYGALNIGKITKFIVQKLAPGTTYYFALVPVANGQAKYTTDAVAAQAKQVYYVEVVETSKEALVQPPPPSAVVTPEESTPEPVVTIPPEENVVEPPADAAEPVIELPPAN